MRMLIPALCVAFLAGACMNGTGEDYDPSRLPKDKASIIQLNDQQLSELRRVVRQCDDLGRSNHGNSFCVISNLDQYIRLYGTPDLKAFHFSMMPIDRYDEYRTLAVLQRFISGEAPRKQ